MIYPGPPFDNGGISYSDIFFSGQDTENSTAPLVFPLSQSSPLLPSVEQLPQEASLSAVAKRKATVKKERGDDTDNVYRAKGDTVYKALAGDDRITIRKSNNKIIAGRGSDILDASKGKGDNVLKGGGGDDELIGGGQDDLLVGGGGADQLVIADGKFNKGISIIKGFKKGDTIALFNSKRADEFSDLTFKKSRKDTLVRVGNRDIALVQNTKPKALKQRGDDFIFKEVDTKPDPNISIADITILEGDVNNSVSITATLDTFSSAPVTVDYSTANGTAIANSDYTPTNGTITFNPGSTSQTITVPIIGDTLPEGTETFVVNLTNGEGTTIADGQAIVTITDDDEVLISALSVSDIDVFEGNADSTITVTVSLDTPASSPVTVDYSTINGTATAGADYTAVNGTLTFAPNITTQTFTVPIIGDILDEPDETFSVNLANPVNGAIADGQALITIKDNDGDRDDNDEPGIFISNLSISEGNTNNTAIATVTLDTPLPIPVTVSYRTEDETATAGSDYTSVTGTLTFGPQVTSQTIVVPIIGDNIDESDETFLINLNNATNAIIQNAQAQATIIDNDETRISIGDVSITEGNSDGTAAFTVTLDNPSASQVTVSYSTSNGTATAGSDYTGVGETLTFAPGTTTQTISVPIQGDTTDENNETFFVNLTNAQNGAIADSQGQGLILDDDDVALSISDVSILEGDNNSTAIFTVTLDAPPPSPVTVRYATANGTATAGNDYISTNNILTFPANTTSQTISVTTIGDNNEEDDETFSVNLSNPVGLRLVDTQATATIVNDERSRRRGKDLSKPSRTPDLFFKIYDTLANGQIIFDGDDRESVGFFEGAIEDFLFATLGGFLDQGLDTRLEFEVGNLTATRSGNTISYLFSSNNLDVEVDDENFDPIQDDVISGNAIRLILDLDADDPDILAIPDDFDPVKAVNDLEYIIDNYVFSYAIDATAYGGTSVDDVSFSSDIDICDPDGDDTFDADPDDPDTEFCDDLDEAVV